MIPLKCTQYVEMAITYVTKYTSGIRYARVCTRVNYLDERVAESITPRHNSEITLGPLRMACKVLNECNISTCSRRQRNLCAGKQAWHSCSIWTGYVLFLRNRNKLILRWLDVQRIRCADAFSITAHLHDCPIDGVVQHDKNEWIACIFR